MVGSAKKIAFLTNLPAPYRFPIWDKMAEFVDLKVYFLMRERNWRNWSPPINKIWRYEFLGLRSIRIREYDLIPQIFGVKRVLKGIDLVIIGSWEIPFYMRTIFYAKKSGIPIVQFYESINASQRFKSGVIAYLRSVLIRKATLVVTFGPGSTNAVVKMGVPPSSILELFNPVDVSWFNSFAVNNRVTESKGHKYIYVGQLIERKNIFNLIDAFEQIRTELDTLTLVGEGKLFVRLKEYVRFKSLEGKVIFTGQKNQSELASIYSRSNTLILPSENEVWGLVVNEALACGLHVVVSKKSGVSSFVEGMPGAYLCNTDSKSIALGMASSRRSWNGYLEAPLIMKFTPEKFAEQLILGINKTITRIN